jgi:hypothetical protein
MWTKVLIYMVLFYLVANPATFKLVRKALGAWVASAEGLPTSAGLLLHSAVYVLLACYLPSQIVSGYAGAPGMTPSVDPVAQAQMDAKNAQMDADKANAKLAGANAYATALKASMAPTQQPAMAAGATTTSKYADEYADEYAEY